MTVWRDSCRMRQTCRSTPIRLISHSSSTPEVSRTRDRTVSPSVSMSAALAPPRLMRKLQCSSETWAAPTIKPRHPAASMSCHALRRGGVFKGASPVPLFIRLAGRPFPGGHRGAGAYTRPRLRRDVAESATQPDHDAGNTAVADNEVGAEADDGDGNLRRQMRQEVRQVLLVFRHEQKLRRPAHPEPCELGERLVGDEPPAQLRHLRLEGR